MTGLRTWIYKNLLLGQLLYSMCKLSSLSGNSWRVIELCVEGAKRQSSPHTKKSKQLLCNVPDHLLDSTNLHRGFGTHQSMRLISHFSHFINMGNKNHSYIIGLWMAISFKYGWAMRQIYKWFGFLRRDNNNEVWQQETSFSTYLPSKFRRHQTRPQRYKCAAK